MKAWILILLLPPILFTVSCEKATLKDVSVSSERDKNLYALGTRFGSGLKGLQLTEEEAMVVARGLYDESRGNVIDGMKSEERGAKLQQFLSSRKEEIIKETILKGEEFLEEFVKSGATKTASGLAYKVIKTGTGPAPAKNDMVVINYKASLIDGTVYAHNEDQNGPAMFSMQQLIPGWAEGMMLMKAGGKMKMVIPQELAFGKVGLSPSVPGGSTIVVDVELVAVPAGVPDKLKQPPQGK
jgi:FKBP-type peptidyl-prolyl cis-trans isomerase FkpA